MLEVLEVWMLLIVLYALVWLHSRQAYKKAPVKDRTVYLFIAAYVVYLSADCVMRTDLFDLYSLADAVFGPGARGIVKLLEVPLQ